MNKEIKLVGPLSFVTWYGGLGQHIQFSTIAIPVVTVIVVLT